MFVLTLSSFVPRFHAENTPVTTPTMIATTVPSATIGMVFASASRRLSATGCWLLNETPRLPWKSCCT